MDTWTLYTDSRSRKIAEFDSLDLCKKFADKLNLADLEMYSSKNQTWFNLGWSKAA